MKVFLWTVPILVILTLGLAACAQPAAEPTKSPTTTSPAAAPPSAPTASPTTPPSPTSVPEPKASVYLFNAKSPNIVEIDGETNEIVRKADVPELASKWSWMDPDNYFDGKELWGATIDSDTGQKSRVFSINLDSLKVTDQIDLGQEKYWLYVGKTTKDGKLPIAVHGLWKMAVIDPRTHQVQGIYDVPVNRKTDKDVPPGFAACDMDTSAGPDGIERAFVPTLNGNTVVSLDPKTGKVLKEASFPDSRPVMLTAGPDKNVWVQEAGTNTNAILDHATLEVLARFPTGKGPVLASFSPDGKIGYIGTGDTMFTVVDVATRTVIKNVQVGANTQMVAPHPNGKVVYVILTKENAVAVVSTSNWEVIKRIDLGTAPSGIFVRRR